MFPTGAGAIAYSFITKDPTNHLPNTPGVQNIEARYSIGGGAPDHLPAGGTQRGDKDQTTSRSITTNGSGKRRQEGAKIVGEDH